MDDRWRIQSPSTQIKTNTGRPAARPPSHHVSTAAFGHPRALESDSWSSISDLYEFAHKASGKKTGEKMQSVSRVQQTISLARKTGSGKKSRNQHAPSDTLLKSSLVGRIGSHTFPTTIDGLACCCCCVIIGRFGAPISTAETRPLTERGSSRLAGLTVF